MRVSQSEDCQSLPDLLFRMWILIRAKNRHGHYILEVQMEPMVLETITRILQRSVATMEHAAPYQIFGVSCDLFRIKPLQRHWPSLVQFSSNSPRDLWASKTFLSFYTKMPKVPPNDLNSRNSEVEKMGLEPTAICLQSRRSTIELRPQQLIANVHS